MHPALVTSPDGATWPASLNLRFVHNESGTRLASSDHHGPLYVQKAFYPEGAACAHIYLLHPPGGVVSGDSLDTALVLEPAAEVLVTTPGAQRFYRARQDRPEETPLPQRVQNKLEVHENATLEWLPGETIVFDGAEISLSTRVELVGTGQFFGWEVVCLGLPAGNEPFLTGSFQQTFAIFVDGQPKVIDRLSFDAASTLRQVPCGLDMKPVIGTLIFGPLDKLTAEPEADELVDQLRAHLGSFTDYPDYEDDLFSVTVLDHFLLLRYLGMSAERARKLFVCAWEFMRPLGMDRTAVKPRIWAT